MFTTKQKENLKKWAAELRSGKYNQVRHTLVSFLDQEDETKGIGFCCLGVAAMLEPSAHIKEDDGNCSIYHGLAELGGWLDLDTGEQLGLRAGRVMPLPLRFFKEDKWETPFGTFDGYGHSEYSSGVSFAYLNDSKHFTFEQIADFIDWAISVWEEEDA